MSTPSQTAQWVSIVALALVAGLQRHELASQRRSLLQQEPSSPFAAGEDVEQLREQISGVHSEERRAFLLQGRPSPPPTSRGPCAP